MSDNEDTVEILLEDDKNIAKDDTISVQVDDNAKKRTIEPEEGINDLKMKLEQERNGRIEAEKQARQATEAALVTGMMAIKSSPMLTAFCVGLISAQCRIV